MAIQVKGTTVIDDSRNITDVEDVGNADTVYYGDGSNLTNLNAGSWEHLGTIEADDVSTVDITGVDSTYDNYVVTATSLRYTDQTIPDGWVDTGGGVGGNATSELNTLCIDFFVDGVISNQRKYTGIKTSGFNTNGTEGTAPIPNATPVQAKSLGFDKATDYNVNWGVDGLYLLDAMGPNMLVNAQIQLFNPTIPFITHLAKYSLEASRLVSGNPSFSGINTNIQTEQSAGVFSILNDIPHPGASGFPDFSTWPGDGFITGVRFYFNTLWTGSTPSIQNMSGTFKLYGIK